MSTLFDILKDSAIAVLSGGGGVGAAVWKFSGYIHSVNARIKILEEKSADLAKKLDGLREDHEKKWGEIEDGCSKCKSDIGTKFDANRGEHNRFVSLTAFNSFVKEQNELWQEMNRMLGRIEGEIAARRGSWTNE